MSDKIELQFTVDPYYLRDKTFIKDAVRVVIIDPEAIFLTGILGESDRKMVEAGFPFYFNGALAAKLIEKGIAAERWDTERDSRGERQ